MPFLILKNRVKNTSNQRSPLKYLFTLSIILFILFDSGYSLFQFYHTPIGGDLAEIVNPTPEKGCYHVLQNPLGIGNKDYACPNRYFAHITTKLYFKYVPLFLQLFTAPITSIYLAVAIAKLIIQLFIIYTMTSVISFSKNSVANFLLTFLLFIPFFQTHGYNRYMGVIDQSVVYAMFYALPIGISLFFMKKVFNSRTSLSLIETSFYTLLVLYICLNGPLIPGILIVAIVVFIFHLAYKTYTIKPAESFLKSFYLQAHKLPSAKIYLISLAGALSLYSIWVGSFDGLNVNSVSLLERYTYLPNGFWRLISRKLGYILLLTVIIVNCIWSKRLKVDRNLHYYIILFAVLYTLLLPLGGYRDYRPNILRYDTVLPITLGLIFIAVDSSIRIINKLTNNHKIYYSAAFSIVLLIFCFADTPKTSSWKCESNLMRELSESTDKLIQLSSECPLMEWNIFTNPDQSELNSKLFYWWNITETEKRYIQK